MSTKTKAPPGDTVEAIGEEIAALDKEIQNMEAELQEEGTPLSWDEITSSTAEELAAKEQRRGILPRLIRAAKIKRLELRSRQLERELEPAREEVSATYERYQRAEARLRKTQEEHDSRQGEWNVALSTVHSLEERMKRLERDRRELKGEER